jgi:predicted nucleic acid-binding protein
MIYLDANVFLTATLDEGGAGKNAKALLRQVQVGGTAAATSALTYDEVFWLVKKHRGHDDALMSAGALLMLPNLTIIDVTVEVVWRAHKLLEEYSLDPRDAIHAACALTRGIKKVVSEDRHFDRVKGIKRASIKGFK